MPTGPKGQKRPADAIGLAVTVAKIATGEIEDTKGRSPNRAKGGKTGGKARKLRFWNYPTRVNTLKSFSE